jgi:hypothetical protein
MIDSGGQTSCEKIRFRSNPVNDIERATELLEGHLPRNFSDYDALVALLNADYDNSCKSSMSYGIETNITVTCAKAGRSATLIVTSPDTHPPQDVPATLTVCMLASTSTCKSINLTGQKFQDLEQAKALLSSNIPVSEYQQLVDLLYSRYTQSDCHTSMVSLPPGPTEVHIACSIPGSNATLSAEQVTGQTEPVPRSLQVCTLGSYDNVRCQNVDFVGKANKDLKLATYLLGIDE